MFNEVYDTTHDRINKPHRPIVSGRIRRSSALKVSLALFSFALVWSFIAGPALFLLTAVSVTLGVMYSLPAVRMKDNLITSMVTLGLGYGVIIPIAPWFMVRGADMATGASIALLGFLWFSGTTNFKDFKDVPGDSVAGTRSLVLLKGERLTLKVMAILMVFLPGLLLVSYVIWGLLPAMSLLGLFALLLTLVVIVNLLSDYTPERANRGYKITYILYPMLYALISLGFLGGA
jgi:4-hydroxybenzoate polyprenyltransferase